MALSSDIPKFESFDEGELTIKEARKYRDALIENMDAMATSAIQFIDKPQIFDSMRDEYKNLQSLSFLIFMHFDFNQTQIQNKTKSNTNSQERLYRRFSFKIFSKSQSNDNSIKKVKNYAMPPVSSNKSLNNPQRQQPKQQHQQIHHQQQQPMTGPLFQSPPQQTQHTQQIRHEPQPFDNDIPPVPHNHNNNNNNIKHQHNNKDNNNKLKYNSHSQSMITQSIVDYHSDEEKCDNLETDRGPKPNRPFIEDDINNNNYQNKSQSKQDMDQQRGKEQELHIAELLFQKHPHPINCDDLYNEYWQFYQEPLEIEDIDKMIQNNKYTTKSENPFINDYNRLINIL